MQRVLLWLGIIGGLVMLAASGQPAVAGDWIRELQTKAVEQGRADFGHWGADPKNYIASASHSNRLIPIYTFGTKGFGKGVRPQLPERPEGCCAQLGPDPFSKSRVDLTNYTGSNSPYRHEAELKRIYGRLPEQTLNPTADYLDQTNVYDIQLAGATAGKKHIFLVVFDGMDWDTTRAAAIHATQKVAYTEGRGSGLHWLDYDAAGTTQFGYMVTSAHNEGTDVDPNAQSVKNPGGKIFGGYDVRRGGATPWAIPPSLPYLIAQPVTEMPRHNYTDSSSSATSMTAGIKTFNGGVNVDYQGVPVETIAHRLQSQGWLVGAISSVPISHATPAASYAHNVERDDYQDLTRDLLGLKSVSHPTKPLAGLDVLIGGGFGHTTPDAKAKNSSGKTPVDLQGTNFVPGNTYLTQADQQAIDIKHGGRYIVAAREAKVHGAERLQQAAKQAASTNQRLLGFYGNGKYNGHLPFATADGDFQPALGRSKKAETYAPEDLTENPTLADMTRAGITAIARPDRKFWLMVEAGDVDWANHDNNLDNSIGAVKSGDAAIKVITDWVEKNSNWTDTLLIVTADHGHLLVLDKPELLITPR